MSRQVKFTSLFLVLVLLVSFVQVPMSSAAENTSSTVTLATYANDYADTMYGFTVSFYDDIDSRGFAWYTPLEDDVAIADYTTELYLKAGTTAGQTADFSTATRYEGTTQESTGTVKGDTSNYVSHKVHACDLAVGDYSFKAGYKIDGAEVYYRYGSFTISAVGDDDEIVILNMNDAQTKNPDLLYKWENAVRAAVSQIGQSNIDFIAFGGDQFDTNMSTVTLDRTLRGSAVKDTISNIIGSIPYVPTAGNHDSLTNDWFKNSIDINFAGSAATGAYYSFDYGPVHFIVLNSNLPTDAAQLAWTEADLAASSSAEWRIVLMHNGPYVTGDHGNGSATQNLITRYTPLFAEYHVDLVLQAHDHVYSKTLPYKWDGAGYSETWDNADVVNFTPTTGTYRGVEYDVAPNGTYYVSPGAAGHRVGEPEGEEWAVGINGADAKYKSNKYKIEVGTIYGTTAEASTNPATQMYGVLTIRGERLVYDFYTVNAETGTSTLYDRLAISHSELPAANIGQLEDNIDGLTTASGAADIAENVEAFAALTPAEQATISPEAKEKLKELAGLAAVRNLIESDIRQTLKGFASSAPAHVLTAQTSQIDGETYNVRFVVGLNTVKITNGGIRITADYGTGQTKTFDIPFTEVYTKEALQSTENGFVNNYAIDTATYKLLTAATLRGVPMTAGTVTYTVTPYTLDEEGTETTGVAVKFVYNEGLFVSCEKVGG